MSAALELLARDLGSHERTLRRAVAEGTIRGRRPTAYVLEVSDEEQQYVRSHWRVLAALRSALRTEPSVECAVLFGSAARGDDDAHSDLDVLAWIRGEGSTNRFALARRLGARVGRDVQIINFRDARRHPGLLLAVLRDGRVLVDRAGCWPALGTELAALSRESHAYRRGLAADVDEAREFFASAIGPHEPAP